MLLPRLPDVHTWWHAAVRFEHALQAARSLGAGTADASLADAAVRGLEREVAPVARALARVPAQAHRPVPLGGTPQHA